MRISVKSSVLCLLGLVIALVAWRPSIAHSDSFSPKDLDKQTHMAASYGLALSSTLVLRKTELPRWGAVAIASAFTMFVGVFKEGVLDDQFSTGDMIANTIGVTTSAAFVFSFRF